MIFGTSLAAASMLLLGNIHKNLRILYAKHGGYQIRSQPKTVDTKHSGSKTVDSKFQDSQKWWIPNMVCEKQCMLFCALTPGIELSN